MDPIIIRGIGSPWLIASHDNCARGVSVVVRNCGDGQERVDGRALYELVRA